jgi:hypothetical protein
MAVERDDVVLVSYSGRLLHARVLGGEFAGCFRIAPLDPRIRVRRAALAEIADHRARQGDPRPRTHSELAGFDHLLDR